MFSATYRFEHHAFLEGGRTRVSDVKQRRLLKEEQITYGRLLEQEQLATSKALNHILTVDSIDKNPVLRIHRQTLQVKLARIENSLKRLQENKPFGICQMCDRPIHFERLRLMPYAELCIKCQRRFEG